MNIYDYGDILKTPQDLSSSAHIAGGAVRDTVLGRRIKDIDIFLDNAHCDEAAKILRSKFSYVKVGEWVQYECFSDPMVSRVARFEKASEVTPISLIGLAEELDAQENIRRFDFGICMAYWEGQDERMLTSDQFKRDAEGETFTLHRADDYPQFVYSMSRFGKLTADRYRDWTLSVPDRFEELAKEFAFRREWYLEGHGNHFGIEHERTQVLRPKQR
jgi:hypothetical protein